MNRLIHDITDRGYAILAGLMVLVVVGLVLYRVYVTVPIRAVALVFLLGAIAFSALGLFVLVGWFFLKPLLDKDPPMTYELIQLDDFGNAWNLVLYDEKGKLERAIEVSEDYGMEYFQAGRDQAGQYYAVFHVGEQLKEFIEAVK
jgi:hypothetical protein